MLDVASPIATSSQDVSSSGDHADTASTTPESTVLTNVGGSVNQTPSSSASSTPSNLYQINPVSDSVADGTSGDLSSTTSSSSLPLSNAVSDPAMVDNTLETPSLPTSGSDAVGSIGINFAEAPPANTVVDALGSNIQNDATPASGGSDVFGSIRTNSAGASPANAVVDALGSNIQNAIPLTSGSDVMGTDFAEVSPADMGGIPLGSNIQGGAIPLISSGSNAFGSIINLAGASPANTANLLGSSIQNSAIPPTSGSNAFNSIGNNLVGASLANTVVNTIGTNNIPNGVIGLDAFRSIGSIFDGASPAYTLVNPLRSSIQNGVIPPTSSSEAFRTIGTNLAGASQINTMVDTIGSNNMQNLNDAIPLTSVLDAFGSAGTTVNIPVTSDSDAFGSIGNNLAGAPLVNTVVNTIGSNSAITLTGDSETFVPIGTNLAEASLANVMENIVGSNNIPNGVIPLTSGSGALQVGAIRTNPGGASLANTMVNTLGSNGIQNGAIPLKVASNTVSDPLKGCVCNL